MARCVNGFSPSDYAYEMKSCLLSSKLNLSLDCFLGDFAPFKASVMLSGLKAACCIERFLVEYGLRDI